MEGKESVVLFPSLNMGHLIPTVELAKLFVGQGFSVTIVVVKSPFGTYAASESLISHVSSTYPSISFHRLLLNVTPSLSSKHPFLVSQETLRHANPHLLDFLRSMKSTSNVKALVIDMLCTAALDVAKELGIASYIYFTSAASTLIAFLQIPALQMQLDGGSIKELGDTPLHFVCLPPMPASSLTAEVFHRDEVNDAIVYHFERYPRADGIILNTFESLERSAVRALADDDVILPGSRIPPVYCIGPFVVDKKEVDEARHECIVWLDEQPEKSVVFLCFGSMGSLRGEQLKEIGNGLERSGQRFLWVVRCPPGEDPSMMFGPKPDPDLDFLLPEGFLKRTEGRGMVMKSWVPQTAVLGHRSVGAFVSHCGWNSTLEVIREGVPMIAWPLYAEQRMNRLFLVGAKLALAMEGQDKGFVSAEEVESKIKLLMESETGEVIKERMAAMKHEALAARKKNGSSTVALLELVGVVRGDSGRLQKS